MIIKQMFSNYTEKISQLIDGVPQGIKIIKPNGNLSSFKGQVAQHIIPNCYNSMLIDGTASCLSFTLEIPSVFDTDKLYNFDCFIKNACSLIDQITISVNGTSFDYKNFAEIAHIKSLSIPDQHIKGHSFMKQWNEIKDNGLGEQEGIIIDNGETATHYVKFWNGGKKATFSIPLSFISDVFNNFNTPAFVGVNSQININVTYSSTAHLNIRQYYNDDMTYATSGTTWSYKNTVNITDPLKNWNITDSSIMFVYSPLKLMDMNALTELKTAISESDFHYDMWECPGYQTTNMANSGNIQSTSTLYNLQKTFYLFKPSTLSDISTDSTPTNANIFVNNAERYCFPSIIANNYNTTITDDAFNLCKKTLKNEEDYYHYTMAINNKTIEETNAIWKPSELHKMALIALGNTSSSDFNRDRYVGGPLNIETTPKHMEVSVTVSGNAETVDTYVYSNNQIATGTMFPGMMQAIIPKLDGYNACNFVLTANYESNPDLLATEGQDMSKGSKQLLLSWTPPTNSTRDTDNQSYNIYAINHGTQEYNIVSGNIVKRYSKHLPVVQTEPIL